MSFVIGVTGGIGSGKTAVTDRFQSLGVTVVDAEKKGCNLFDIQQLKNERAEAVFRNLYLGKARGKTVRVPAACMSENTKVLF